MDSGEGAEGPPIHESAVLTKVESAKVAAMIGSNHVSSTTADYASHLTKYKVSFFYFCGIAIVVMVIVTRCNASFIVALSRN